MDNNFHDLPAVLDETASDIAQVLPDIHDWPDAVLYFLKALENKAMELDPNQKREFKNTLRYVLTGIQSRLGEGS